MSDARDHAREPRDLRPDPAEDPDPTGVRAILSSLPDPGPMPLDLVHRITASLDLERTRGDLGAHGEGASPNGHGRVTSLSAARERRAPAGRIPVIAVAASIVVLAGAVVMGMLMTGWGLGMGASYDTAVEQLAGADADGGVAEGGAGDEGATTGAETFGSTETAPQTDETDDRSMATAGIAVLATGAVLTDSTLSEHARVLRDDPATLGHDPDAEVALAASSVGTTQGAAGCLGGLLSIPTEEAMALVAGMDVVRFDGTFVAVIIASDPGTGAGQPPAASTAYLVPLDCGPRAAALLHAPVRIRS